MIQHKLYVPLLKKLVEEVGGGERALGYPFTFLIPEANIKAIDVDINFLVETTLSSLFIL